jgi:integrase/recombinase XerC
VNRTRALYTSRLDLLFRWLQDEGHRSDLPTKGLPRAKIPRSVPRPIPTEGLFAALACADARTGLMITLTAFAGMRRSEIAQMDRSDVLDDRDPPLLLIHGKGQKERLVPIGPAVAEAFARYKLPASGPIFPGRQPFPGCQPGTTIRPHTVGLLISTHLRACGVDCTAHQGRHTFATRLYQTSGDLRLTQELMGHASPATTAIYAAYAPEKAADAIANL